MLDYTGIKCPVCEVPFKAGDDVVVCPQCGAPYHRECYQKEGQCIFQEEHAQGKDWEPPKPPQAPDTRAEIKDQECPTCGILNAHSSLFCSHCGASLSGEPQVHQNTPPKQPPYGATPPVPPPSSARSPFYGTAAPFAYDPMGGVSPTETLEDNVTYGDASKLVKQNTAYYMPVFRYMKQTGRGKFNFSAFLFSGAWMLYRKQYKYGAIVTGLLFLVYIAYMCCSIFVSTPVLLDVMQQVGMDISAGFAPSSDQMIAITELLTQNPTMYFQISLPLICLLFMLVIMLVVGFRGNRMYLNHCVRTVRSIKASHQGADIGAAIEDHSGVNLSIAICLFVCYMLLINLPLLIP